MKIRLPSRFRIEKELPEKKLLRFPRASRVNLSNRPWWQLVLIIGLGIALGLGMLEALRMLAYALALFALGVTIASALFPMVRSLSRKLPRTVSIILVYIVMFLILFGMGLVIVPPLAGQAAGAIKRLPDLVRLLQQVLNQLGQSTFASLIPTVTAELGRVGTGLLTLPLTITSIIFDLVLVLFVSIYALIEAPSIQRFVLSFFPEEYGEDINQLIHEIIVAMGGYVRGAVINGLIIGICMYIGLMIIGVDFPIVLSMQAGLLELIPVIGAILAAIPILGIAYLQSPAKALTVLIFVIILQETESHILVPNVMRRETTISPLLATLSIFAGGAIGGLLGALVAIPIISALSVFLDRVIIPAVRIETGAVEEGGNHHED